MSQHFQEFVRDFFPITAGTRSCPHVGQPSQRSQPSHIPQPRVIQRRQPIAIQAPSPALAPGPRTTYEVYEMNARDRAVAQQKNTAFRENPRLFQRETMLYVDAIISGHRMPLFVDTGAQASVMSLKTCKRLGLMTSVDVSQAGVATGVGFTRIHGKLWRVPVQIGRTKFHMQFNILDMGVSVILGLDQMKRLGMSVDLRKGGLQIGACFVPFTKPPPEDDDTQLMECDVGACAVM